MRLRDNPAMPGERPSAREPERPTEPPSTGPPHGKKAPRAVAGASQAESPRQRSRWWSNPAIVISAIIGVIGICISAYLSLHPHAAPAVDSAAACREKHPDARETPIPGKGGSTHFTGCTWPPVIGADSSGYWALKVQDYEIPGSYAARKFTTIEVFITSCFALTLDYQFDSQGTVAHSRFTVDTTQTVSGYDGQYVNIYGEVPDPPQDVVRAQSTHLIVLINSRYSLRRVRCSDLSGAPQT